MEKKNLLKIALFIVLILLLLTMIHTFKNYAILKNLATKIETNNKSTNYSYSFNTKNNASKTEVRYKDGIVVFKGENNTTWFDIDSGEMIEINHNEHTAKVQKNVSDSRYGGMPVVLVKNTIMQAFTSFISSDEINGIDCYILGNFCVSKEDGTLIRVYLDNNYTNYTNWRFDQLTNADVAIPDLSGYEII